MAEPSWLARKSTDFLGAHSGDILPLLVSSFLSLIATQVLVEQQKAALSEQGRQPGKGAERRGKQVSIK
jgi:hypothetical protein